MSGTKKLLDTSDSQLTGFSSCVLLIVLSLLGNREDLSDIGETLDVLDTEGPFVWSDFAYGFTEHTVLASARLCLVGVLFLKPRFPEILETCWYVSRCSYSILCYTRDITCTEVGSRNE